MHNDPLLYLRLLGIDRDRRVLDSYRKQLAAARAQARRDEIRLARARVELDRAIRSSDASRTRLAELVHA